MAEQYCGECGNLHKPPLHEICKCSKGKRTTPANPEPSKWGGATAESSSKPIIKPESEEQPVMLSEEEECRLEERVKELEKKKMVADLLLRERRLEEELKNLVMGIEE